VLDGERRDLILEILRHNLYATVGRLAEETAASETTIRRDLRMLESDKVISRMRGGAALAPEFRNGATPLAEEPFEARLGLNRDAKRRIAERAVSLCEDGETIFVDGGSTTYQMVEFLRLRSLTIVTNSFAIAQGLVSRSGIRVIIPGGVVDGDSRLILDPFGHDTFRDYTATKAFLSVGGVTEKGALNSDALLIRTERSMVKHAEQLVVLADASKLGKSAPMRLCGVESIGVLITDGAPDDALNKLLLSAEVHVIRV
jgi:DeoR family ulaG and ulaABCDEF operon transcriptional repressor